MHAFFKSLSAFGLCALPLVANIASVSAIPISNTTLGATSWGASCIDVLVPVEVEQSAPGEYSLASYDVNALFALAARQTLASNTYNISMRICTPSANDAVPEYADTVQVMVHGATFNKIMWDLPYQPERYSWTKKMNEAGYATIAVDLVGAGNSSFPNGLLEAQTATFVEVMHQVVLQLRAGTLYPERQWNKIVLVGFSIGGAVSNSLAERYPSDVDVIVLLGISWDLLWIYPAFLAGLQEAARNIDPARWGALPAFYQTHATLVGREVACFYGAYDRGALEADFANRDFDSLGAAITLPYHLITAPVFSGPVFMGIGENDGTFCGVSCGSEPYAVYDRFPAASTHQVRVYPETGHLLLFHYSGMQLMDDILAFLEGV